MSSRFVSAGSFAVEAGVAQPAAPAPATSITTAASKPPPLPSLSSSTKSPVVGVTEKDPTASSSSALKSAPLTTSISPPPSIPAASISTTTTQSQPPAEEPLNPKSAEWLAVETQLAQERENRLQAKKAAAAAGAEEKSLYEVLQANKAAKQAAFEEANKIKNQFRALDDDEIDFLDEVLMRKRAEEQRIRRETEEGLDLFRRAQQMGGNKSDEEEEMEEILGVFEGRKRRRKGGQHEGEGKSKRMLVRKKTSGEGQDPEKETAERDKSQATTVAEKGPSTGSTANAEEAKPAVVMAASKPTETTTTKPGTSASSGGGLGGLLLGYGSSDEDDG
ncbi:N-terminal domain of NEFA-interacting nuclear protein NIP30 domain containing protein [Rhypophila decipiens]